MQLADVMREIEQYRFASELNLASGTKAFRRGLRAHELFRSLVDLSKEQAGKAAVARRVEELAETQVDLQYENRYDTALSTYLMALGDTAEPEVIAKAAMAATRARNTWWTVGISHDLVSHAVATGVAQAPAPTHVIAAHLLKRVDWHRAMRNWLFHSETAASSLNSDVVYSILQAYRAAELTAQAAKPSNVVVMPQPNEEGERPVWKPRRRPHKKHTGMTHPRPRQYAQA